MRSLALLLVLLLAVAACGGASTTSPSGVVRTALDRLEARDLEGLQALACAGASDALFDQLGVPGQLGGEILPGVDVNAVLDAVTFGTDGLTIEDEVITGTTATVAIRGDIEITFEAERIRPVLRALMEARGESMTDAQLDALITLLTRTGQDLPVDQSIGLVQEGGSWRLCSVDQ